MWWSRSLVLETWCTYNHMFGCQCTLIHFVLITYFSDRTIFTNFKRQWIWPYDELHCSLRAYKLTTVQLLVFWSESRGINCHVYSLMKLEASGTIKENKRVWYPDSVNFMEMWSLKLFLSLQRLNFCFTFKSGGDATWIFSNE